MEGVCVAEGIVVEGVCVAEDIVEEGIVVERDPGDTFAGETTKFITGAFNVCFVMVIELPGVSRPGVLPPGEDDLNPNAKQAYIPAKNVNAINT